MLPEVLNMENVHHQDNFTFGTYQGAGFCFWSDDEGIRLEVIFMPFHYCANRLLISALISKDKFFEAKSLLLDMKAQDYDTEFVEEKLAEVEERINGQKTE